jgi:hypothetical protein
LLNHIQLIDWGEITGHINVPFNNLVRVGIGVEDPRHVLLEVNTLPVRSDIEARIVSVVKGEAGKEDVKFEVVSHEAHLKHALRLLLVFVMDYYLLHQAAVKDLDLRDGMVEGT